MKIYTRTGDDGSTSLSGGRRIPKSHLRVEAYGTVDELISWTGLLKDLPENKNREKILVYIQDQLMRCAATLASEVTRKKRSCLPEEGSVKVLEKEIDRMESGLKELRNFILPGGNLVVSYCHITRTVCRRAERAAVKLNETEKIPEIILTFLNRLSDYYYVLSRRLSLELDNKEVRWPL